MRTTGFTEAELAAAAWSRQQKLSTTKRKRSRSLSSVSSSLSRKERRRSRRKDRSRRQSPRRYRRSSSTSFSDERSDSFSIPHDPPNPLQAAYELPRHKVRHLRSRERNKSFRKTHRGKHTRCSSPFSKIYSGKLQSDLLERSCRRRRRRVSRSLERRSTDSERWTHDVFETRSESPNRERTEGSMWDTRRGAWRSRAGGVCLPPSPPHSDRSDDLKKSMDRPKQRLVPSKYKHPRPNTTKRYFAHSPRKHSRSPSFVPRERGSPVYE